ncbi:hypothetical protein CEE45_05035 [Candidatus Heimdallarchaeota archaeon B3_Heim]|nr:MAG: hypothetical protein CEE45_05035 [Candidatus Heimdallarchaeota archaeon B3_Heim]
MVGLKISSSELKDIIDILGLSEDEQGVVYINLLSLGMATLGQLSLVSGVDFIQTQETLNVLIGSNLVKRIPGKVGRYIALQPFLKAFFLSYDPLTLINVRKESKDAFEKNTEFLQNNFNQTSEKFREHTSSLTQDFSENLEPITEGFLTISTDQRNLVTSINEAIQLDIQFVKDQIQTIIEKASELYNQINDENIEEIEKLPELFNNIPTIKNQLQNVQQQISSSFEEIRAGQVEKADVINKAFGEGIKRHMNENHRIIENFNTNLAKNRESIEEFTYETKNKLELIRNNAKATQPKFQEFRSSYNDIEENLQTLFSSIPLKLNNIENVISDLISEIKNRKMFRGKEEFIDQLKLVQEEKLAISQLISSSMGKADLLNKLNQDLAEIEDKIVNATDVGVDSTISVFEERRKLFREQLNNIENEFNLNLGKEVNDSLLTIKQGLNDQIMTLKIDSDNLFRRLTQELKSELENSTKIFSEVILNSINEFKQNFKVNLEASKTKVIEESELVQKIANIGELSNQVKMNLNNASKNIIDLDTSLNSYFSGLTNFTSNYADEQLNTFVSNLNESKMRIDEFLEQTERQLEHEVSALIFTIKEMKQKLSKVTNVMSSVELSELDPSLLDTDLVIGEPVIILLLRDLTVRTKSSLTILMPRPELQTLIAASKLPFKTRVTIIGDFLKVPKTTLKKVTSSSNIRLKQLDGIEFWGCIRDAEELLICPEPKNPEKEELVGVITTNGNLVDLFTQEIITYTTRSREILPSDLE